MMAPQKHLYEMTDAELEDCRRGAEERAEIARNLAYECRFHQMLRKNVKREHLKDQIHSLMAELEAVT